MKRVEEKMFMKVTSVYGLTEASPGMTAPASTIRLMYAATQWAVISSLRK